MKLIRTMLTAVLTFGVLMTSSAYAIAEPALWMVKGPHATVYLFGSVHVLKKDAPWRTPKIDAAIQKSGSLWLEIAELDDQKAMQALVMQLGVDPQHPLSTRLNKEELAKLDAVAKSAGLPGGEAAMEPLRPWTAAMTLSMIPMIKAGYDPSSGVELILKPEFVKAAKAVHGFETAAEQLHFLADMPERAQVDYLDSTVKDFDAAAEKFNKIVASWYAGDQEALNDEFNGEFRAKYPELYQTLIVRRNEGFTKQIAELLKGDGTSFVAVGAAHLVGPDGVPAMLEKLGFTVARQ
jgi:uncharacterized protein YbaP (TraB family)